MCAHDTCPTIERILDSAERLFAQNGFDQTSLRAITTEARANLAAVNYHFGSKEELVRQLFLRRMGPVNRVRMEKLSEAVRQAEAENRRPTVREVVTAFVGPTIEMALTGERGRSIVRLIARSMAEPDGALRRAFKEAVEPAFATLLDAMCQALPERDSEEVKIGLMISMSATGNAIMHLSADNDGHFPDWKLVRDKMISFITAGLEAG